MRSIKRIIFFLFGAFSIVAIFYGVMFNMYHKTIIPLPNSNQDAYISRITGPFTYTVYELYDYRRPILDNNYWETINVHIFFGKSIEYIAYSAGTEMCPEGINSAGDFVRMGCAHVKGGVMYKFVRDGRKGMKYVKVKFPEYRAEFEAARKKRDALWEKYAPIIKGLLGEPGSQ